ncbi:hypothetical protein GIB67_006332 [Kingdonia uniflora]|uniref:Cation/H+ exchanger domain-containing protein n=1 Tax=Kingdonia uniflora TaxID=39325 RepID=A0A7J7P0J1_9MAGN|nr:hypothetical protein GIB67_006332 [Kingdonia uniflora]
MASNITCPTPMKATSNGVFQGDSPLDFSLPLVILQILIVIALSRGLAIILKPMRQPRVIAEIIGGVLLGPSALGRNKTFLNNVFPSKSLTVLDTLANIGLLLFLFLVGIELDPKSLRRTGKKALLIAMAGISVPFALGIGNSVVLRATISKGVDGPPFIVFMGVALSITAFPVLARILAELKLLTTDAGRMAMSAAAVNDVAAWILLALAISLSGTGRSPLISLWVLFCGCGFVAGAIVIVRPIFSWMSKRCHDGEPVDEMYICATLGVVLAAGFITDAIGIHALFGAFVVGILVPNEGPLAGALVEKVEDLVSGLFLPLYFASSGLKTNVATIQGLQSWGLLVMVIATACCGKIIGTVLVSLACKMPFREALALGFLMNTKGLVELIVLNIGKDRKVLNDETFAIMVLMALFTTFITTPLVVAVYKPARRASKVDYKHRTVERKDTNTQLRILTCFHSSSNIPTMINLIEVSRGIERREGLNVYAMHLMELSERSSAIRMVHKSRRNGSAFSSKLSRTNSDHIVVAFEAFQQLSRVTVKPMTAISGFSNIHEDICSSAEKKSVAMVILPFHMEQRVDGVLETTRYDFRSVNQKVLENAPCSVGILVDRGLGGSAHVSASDVSSTFVVLFFGGPDDREALAYGARTAEHPGVNLTVVRIIVESAPGNETHAIEVNEESAEDSDAPTDNTFFSEIKQKISKNDSVNFEDRLVKNFAETVNMIKEFSKSNLFLVGRNPKGVVAASWSGRLECQELGPIGSLLTSPSFSTTASVLVIQQYRNKNLSDLAPHS